MIQGNLGFLEWISSLDFTLQGEARGHLQLACSAIHIKPLSGFQYETAGFMHALRFAGFAKACSEFDYGVIGVGALVAVYGQAQPACAMRRVGWLQIQLLRARAGVPTGQQISGIRQGKGGIARAHQAFGIGRDCGAAYIRFAAMFVGRTEREPTTRAGGVG